MLFISKTVRDRAISSYFLTIWILEIFGILPLKNVKFLKFRPPYSMLLEVENVGYLKNLYRQSDFEQILNQCKRA